MNFSPITVNDYKKLKIFFKAQPYQLSTYSLFSIIVWSNPNTSAYSAIEDDTLIICNESENNPDGRHLILPLSHTKAINPEYLYNLARNTGFMRYCFVPETFIIKYGWNELENYFTVIEQPEFEDYIYLREDLAKLKGNKYAKQRNLIHQFHKLYLDKGKVTVETINNGNLSECIEYLYVWCDQRSCDLGHDESLACEKLAAINALNNLDIMESKGILVRINDVVNAFGICSYLTEDMGVLNFEKADSNVKGLYQFLDNECALRLFSQYKYINKESDMNLPNLAQSKNSYNPIKKLKSYCLTID
jgi:uncharacterized protein